MDAVHDGRDERLNLRAELLRYPGQDPASYVVSAAIQALAVPFAFLARRENAVSDPIGGSGAPADA